MNLFAPALASDGERHAPGQHEHGKYHIALSHSPSTL